MLQHGSLFKLLSFLPSIYRYYTKYLLFLASKTLIPRNVYKSDYFRINFHRFYSYIFPFNFRNITTILPG